MAYIDSSADRKYVLELIDNFIEKNKDNIELDILYTLHNYIEYAFDFDAVPFIIGEFLHYNNLTNKDVDLYNKMFNIIDNYIESLDKKSIVEVGSGFIPILSKILADKTTKNVYSYDPNILLNSFNHNNLKLIKKIYTPKDSINPDLFVGLMPCNGTNNLIEGAFKNNSDLILALCDCSHFDENETIPLCKPYLSYIWRNDIIKKVENLTIKNKYNDFSVDKDSMPFEVIKCKKRQ